MSEFNLDVLDLAGIEEWLGETGALDIADEIERLDPTRSVIVFRLLPRDRALVVFEALEPAIQQEILDGLRDERVRHLIEELDPDDRARLITELPAKVAKRVLGGLTPVERRYTSALLGYPEESAGRVMTPEFVSLRSSMTVADSLAKIRRTDVEEETLYNLPVTDDERRLVGSIDLPTLVRSTPDEEVGSLLGRDIHSVHATEDQEVAARLIREANLAALPVVDSEDRLVGMITVDDAMRVLEQEETEDRSRAGGAEPLRRPYFSVSLLELATKRATWLLVLLAGATLTVNVLGAFEGTMEQYLPLALFIPLLIGTGGNTGAQATTVVIRAMSIGEVRFSDLPKVVWREARVGVLLGAMLATIGFGPVALVWDFRLATVVSLTILVVCSWATFAGSMLPMVAERVGVDPTVVSAPFITTLVDATGLVIYFLIAQVILGL
ncbi:magnesium transporter [soil metagenome]